MITFSRKGISERKRAGSQRLPASLAYRQGFVALPGHVGRGFTTGMGQLNSRHNSLSLDEAGDRFEPLNMPVRPDAAVRRGDPPFRRHGGGLEHDQRNPSDGTSAKMNKVPVGRRPIFTGVLTHGRKENAIFELNTP
jgi:hypothetical protein